MDDDAVKVAGFFIFVGLIASLGIAFLASYHSIEGEIKAVESNDYWEKDSDSWFWTDGDGNTWFVYDVDYYYKVSYKITLEDGSVYKYTWKKRVNLIDYQNHVIPEGVPSLRPGMRVEIYGSCFGYHDCIVL